MKMYFILGEYFRLRNMLKHASGSRSPSSDPQLPAQLHQLVAFSSRETARSAAFVNVGLFQPAA
jgi:hypothetical protein